MILALLAYYFRTKWHEYTCLLISNPTFAKFMCLVNLSCSGSTMYSFYVNLSNFERIVCSHNALFCCVSVKLRHQLLLFIHVMNINNAMGAQNIYLEFCIVLTCVYNASMQKSNIINPTPPPPSNLFTFVGCVEYFTN